MEHRIDDDDDNVVNARDAISHGNNAQIDTSRCGWMTLSTPWPSSGQSPPLRINHYDDWNTPLLNDDLIPNDDVIDNTELRYLDMRLRGSGVMISCRPAVLMYQPGILEDLYHDVQDVLTLLPANVHNLIHRTRIWVHNDGLLIGRRDQPQHLRHVMTHHHPEWLQCARDRLDKCFGIEIYHAGDYRRMRLHWNGCGMLLHEYCHLIHQLVVHDGLANRVIHHAYQNAEQSQRYSRVVRRDWACPVDNYRVDYDLAYAMMDVKEFFAEMSVAYWSDSYHSFDKADPIQLHLCSPPICEPHVLERIQQARATGRITPRTIQDQDSIYERRAVWGFLGCWCRRRLPHCNKFYPFTRGQLQHYDPDTYRVIHSLWREISAWKDPEQSNNTPNCDPRRGVGGCCFVRWRGQNHHTGQQQSHRDSDALLLLVEDTVDL